MKKEYQKPKIAFSSFELSESIAAGCEYITNVAYGTCTLFLIDSGDNIFNKSINSSCVYEPTPGLDDAVCYHAPNDSHNVFSS